MASHSKSTTKESDYHNDAQNRHDELTCIDDEEVEFLKHWPSYGLPGEIEELRKTEFRRLDENNQVYVDYTGAGLYGESQLCQHVNDLQQMVYGNPHSISPASQASTRNVELTRKAVLAFFNAPSDEYFCIFTLNATGALKLVGEAFPFDRHSQYTLTADNHNSVNGIRDFAQAKGASIAYVSMKGQEIGVDSVDLIQKLRRARSDSHNLFAFPAQSNFSGTQHSLDLVQVAREYNHVVLVDFAAYAPTNKIDIAACKPDFAVFSFYKMFGYPTGVGCLIMRKAAMKFLKRPYFGGGTVHIASVSGGWHFLEPNEAAFEDGTINFLNIPAVRIGLELLKQLDLQKIKGRVMALTGYFISQLLALKHRNNRPLVRLIGSHSLNNRGGIVTFVLLDPWGVIVDEERVEELAKQMNISFRTGCFCNPGGAESAFGVGPDQTKALKRLTDDEAALLDYRKYLYRQYDISMSAIRVSFGLASNFRDVSCLMNFLKTFIDKPSTDVGGFIRSRSCTGRNNYSLRAENKTTTANDNNSRKKQRSFIQRPHFRKLLFRQYSFSSYSAKFGIDDSSSLLSVKKEPGNSLDAPFTSEQAEI